VSTSADTAPTIDQPTAPRPVGAIPLPPVTEEQIRHLRESARSRIATRVVRFYLVMVIFNVTVPFVLYFLPHPDNGFSLSDVRDLILAISSGLSSLVGILGFIVGYYFKAEESATPAKDS
jgi:hypothetical protein